MRKKAVSAILCCILFCAICSVTAFADSGATKRRGAFEFVELYMNRLTVLNQKGSFSSDIWISGNTKWPGTGPDGIASVDTELGLIDVDLNDFSLDRIEITFYDSSDSEKENSVRTFQCIAAISALEYDYDEASRLRIGSQALGGPKDEIEAATAISAEILKTIRGKAGSSGLPDGEFPVYSGNYEYSIYSMTFDVGDVTHSSLELVAEARR